MPSLFEVTTHRVAELGFYTESIKLRTIEGGQLIDLTTDIEAVVAKSGIWQGIINVQTMHTTTAILINENEPLLIEDLKNTLERLVPQQSEYQHNDFSIRTVNMEPGEVPNGHSHCQALFLNSSATLNIINGQLKLGKWQRLFLIELDHARDRTVSIMIMGESIKHSI